MKARRAWARCVDCGAFIAWHWLPTGTRIVLDFEPITVRPDRHGARLGIDVDTGAEVRGYEIDWSDPPRSRQIREAHACSVRRE